MAANPSGYTRVQLLSAVQTGISPWFDARGYKNLTFWLTTHGNPGAGTLIIEEGDWPDTAGVPNKTFSAVVTIDVDTSVGTDGVYAYHLPTGRAYHFVRARVGTDVTVATLDVVVTGN